MPRKGATKLWNSGWEKTKPAAAIIPVDGDYLRIVWINLSSNKLRVFTEAFRVLKPGGRLMVSDIVVLKKAAGLFRVSIDAYIGCVAGADYQNEYIKRFKTAGF